MKRCFCRFSFLVACAVIAGNANGVDLSRVTITCQKDTPSIRWAAETLSNHLVRVCGSVFGGGVEFLIGASPNGVPAAANESRICVKGGKVYIWGDDSEDGRVVRRGTMSAVGGFLEDRLGVRWVWPGEDGMVFSAKKDVDLPEGWNWRYVQSLEQAVMRIGTAQGEVKVTGMSPESLRMNPEDARLFETNRALWTRMMRLREVISFPTGHAFSGWQMRYKKSHPEYLAQTDGKFRGMRKPAQKRWVKLCVSNRAVVDQIITNWVKAGTSEYLNVCPNDYNRGFCRCKECRKLDVFHYKGENLGHLTDRYVNFWNRITKAARAIRPDVKVVTYIYSLYRQPPVREKIAYPENMVFGVVPLHPDDFDSLIDGWKNVGMKRFFLRPNWLYNRAAPSRGLEKHYYDCLRRGIAAGAFGVLYDAMLIAPSVDLERYVLARATSDINIGFDAICDEYYSAYGVAANSVKRWHEQLRKWSERCLEDMRNMNLPEKADDSQYSALLVEHMPVVEVERELNALLNAKKVRSERLSPIEKRRLDRLILRVRHDVLSLRFMQSGEDIVKLRENGRALIEFRVKHKKDLCANTAKIIEADYGERRLWERLGFSSGKPVNL